MNEIERAAAAEFDRWAEKGDDETMASGHGRFTRIALDAWTLGPSDAVLDVGCGNGWAVREMIRRGAGAGAGVDIAPEMIRRATPPGDYRVAAGDALPFEDGRFTHVLSIESVYYYPDPAAALREWARVARPGAALCVLIDLFAENPAASIWRGLLPIPVHVIDEAGWRGTLESAGWGGVTAARILDPRGPRAEADFTPDAWAPTYADYLAFKAAGTLCLRGTLG